MKKLFVTAMIIGFLSIPFVAPAQPAGGGDLTFTLPDALPVVFRHNKHLKERGLRCSSCHYQFFQMAKGSYKMDMGKITKGKFCGRCHNGRGSFDVQDPQNCSRCHR
ncbi:MAG: c(7)-type cytochrome triheme domain-containing protein [Smithellaceae bacterium]|nr:c(7)-type cytochrome triheme domain-containing protein [Smithellaceae bacterium]